MNIPSPGEAIYPSMPEITIDEEGVLKLLRGLDQSKVCGPYKIPTRVLKACATSIAPPLTVIFQQSLKTGEVPNDWLSANIAAIFKNKGSKSEPVNYRPVSLTSVACKILEHILNHNILHNYQHGFLRGHSCESQLLNTLEEMKRYMDQKGKTQVDVQILDFSKVFDTVAHQRLLVKLRYYGVRGSTEKWIESWITN